jgi:hypothetical protein
MNKKINIIPIILFIAMLCQTSSGFGAWVSTVLDIPEGISGINPNYGGISDIAIDSSGNVHISHSDDVNGELRYVTNTSGAWSGISICDFTLPYPTIMIDSMDHVHIYSLKKNANSNIEIIHATIESGKWHVSSTVIDETPVNYFGISNESIYLDNSDNLHIAYVIENSSYDTIIKYATNASGSWTVSDVYDLNYRDPLNISIPSIVLDSARKAHISFIDNESSVGYKLKYATNATGDFLFTDVLQSGYMLISPSIALNKYNRPGIAFMGVDPVSKKGFLKFAERVTDVWAIKNVEDFVRFTHSLTCSLRIDSISKAHISYEYITDVVNAGYTNMYAIKYASNANGSWQTSFIDNNPEKGFTNILFDMRNPSMAIDSSDNLHVSYEAGYGNENSYISYRLLKYATNLPPKFDSTGRWTYKTSGNWYAGAAGCTGDQDGTVSGSIIQEGRIVVGKFDGITSNGYAGGSEYELYAKFPELEGGITKFLTYLSITSGTTASGTLLWFWDGDRPCFGGSNLDLTKIDEEVVPIDYPEPEKSTSLSGFVPILLLDN